MINPLGINYTQFLGIIAFAAATIACLVAAFPPATRDRRIWVVLALINGVFLIEVFFGSRHRIHDMANSLLTAQGTYGDRASIQKVLIMVVATSALIFSTFMVWSRAASASSKLAASTSIAVLALFAIETVSLHALDAVFYQPIGPVLLIGWIWLGACTVSVCTTFWH
jgi:hypothetical protein